MKKPKDTRSNIFILGTVSLLNDFISERIMPILPMFITALGTFLTVIGLTALPSSLIAGFLFQHVPALTFIFGAAVSLTSVVIFIFVIIDRERISLKNAS